MEKISQISTLTTEVWGTAVAHSDQPLALVLSDDRSADLGKLTFRRCTAALPFAGKYRLIDFALSNCVNSGIETIGVITQYQPQSLQTHLAYGRPWGLDRREGGLTLLHPCQTRTGMDWYAGTADAVYQNREFILDRRAGGVLILAANEIHSMDLNVLAAQHRKMKADLTVAVTAIKGAVSSRQSTVFVDHEGRICKLVPPGHATPGPLAVMSALLFSADVLYRCLNEDAHLSESAHDLIRDVIPRMVRSGDRVMASQHTGYWNGLRTVRDYWQASMNLLGEDPALNLQDAAWPIRTQSEVRPPTCIATGAMVSHSLLCEGCIIDGTVEYSLLSPGVHVAPGAVVRHAVVMHDATIEEGAVVDNAILDTEVTVGWHARVGMAHRHAPTLGVSIPDQLTVIQAGTCVPAQETVVTHW